MALKVLLNYAPARWSCSSITPDHEYARWCSYRSCVFTTVCRIWRMISRGKNMIGVSKFPEVPGSVDVCCLSTSL